MIQIKAGPARTGQDRRMIHTNRLRLRPAAALLGAALSALAACQPTGPVEPVARADYTTYCTACHGRTGRGDGPLAASLPRRPADLSRLAARNGGVFPKTRVMSQIDGYIRNRHGGGGPMPEFGYVLEGATTVYDDGSGRPVPVPARLLALAEYLERLQRP
jgi:mono/diheme cytochrome c family protein